MASNPHLAAAPVVSGTPLEEATAVAMMVHGRNQGPDTMMELARRLALDGAHYVYPVASEHCWYPDRFIAPVEANEPSLSQALAAYDELVGRLAGAGWPPERLALVGFSQGACLTLEYVARNARRYGAVAGLTGGLIGAPGELTGPGDLRGTPLLVTTKEEDEWVPPERTRESAEVLAAAGADVDLRILPPGEHGVEEEEVDAVRLLIQRASGREPT